jgi:hypothetical protein
MSGMVNRAALIRAGDPQAAGGGATRAGVRRVPFIGQFRPLTSLTPGGRNRVPSQYRPHGAPKGGDGIATLRRRDHARDGEPQTGGEEASHAVNA